MSLQLVYGVTLGAAALVSLAFLAVYLPQADLRSPVARHLLALNGAVVVVMALAVLRRLAPGVELLPVRVGLLVVVDLVLLHQFVLLRHSRRG